MRTTPAGACPRQCRGGRAVLLVLGLVCASAALPAAPGSRVHTVVIEGMKFSPQRLVVKLGDTVIWKNRDWAPHTATSDGPGFHSAKILPERTWTFVAHQRGAFAYSCASHEPMHGTLIVD